VSIPVASMRKSRAWKTLLESDFFSAGIVVLFALLVGAILMAITGSNPILAYQVLLESAFGSVHGFVETMVKACPLIFAGLGTVVAFKCKFWNIGSEGQIYIGGIAAAFVGGLSLSVPAELHLLLTIMAAFVGGALWATIPALLKYLKINEVITTMMLNYVAILLVSYLLYGPLKDPQSYLPISKEMSSSAILPILVPATRFHLGILIGLLCAILVHFLMWKTVLGYRIRAIGENLKAARLGGINPFMVLLWAAFISGGLSGIAGMAEIAGIQHRLVENFSPGYGYLAIAVALVGNLKPLGVILAAVLFGAFLSGANAMQSFANVPINIVYIIEGLIIVLSSARFLRKRAL